jgi:hypothetical protein
MYTADESLNDIGEAALASWECLRSQLGCAHADSWFGWMNAVARPKPANAPVSARELRFLTM